MPAMEIGRFGIGGLACQRITKPFKKSPNHPLLSTFLHSYPLIKISVRFIFVYAKPYNPINQPSKPILRGYQTIILVPYCPYQTSVIGHIVKPSYGGYGVCYYTRGITTFFTFPPIYGIMVL
jgi:hypothetical protein